MKTKIFTAVAVLLLGAPALLGKDSRSRGPVGLEPPPKEMRLRDGGFKVGPATRIFVTFGHQSEDRIAAETLAEQVLDRSGFQLNILGKKSTGKAKEGAIILARLEDEKVRRFLAKKGLSADQAVGEDGYLLFSDKTHVIVAANTGQGLFYGVQRLRQLLRPAGKALMCPAVGIRDWPGPLESGAKEQAASRKPDQIVVKWP
jgi:hexosaminidase